MQFLEWVDEGMYENPFCTEEECNSDFLCESDISSLRKSDAGGCSADKKSLVERLEKCSNHEVRILSFLECSEAQFSVVCCNVPTYQIISLIEGGD